MANAEFIEEANRLLVYGKVPRQHNAILPRPSAEKPSNREIIFEITDQRPERLLVQGVKVDVASTPYSHHFNLDAENITHNPVPQILQRAYGSCNDGTQWENTFKDIALTLAAGIYPVHVASTDEDKMKNLCDFLAYLKKLNDLLDTPLPFQVAEDLGVQGDANTCEFPANEWEEDSARLFSTRKNRLYVLTWRSTRGWHYCGILWSSNSLCMKAEGGQLYVSWWMLHLQSPKWRGYR